MFNNTADSAMPLPPEKPRSYMRGMTAASLLRPDSILLFSRSHPITQPAAIHHRCVFIACLRTAGTVIVDGTWHRLSPGTAMLVLPYQLHHYAEFDGEALRWLYVTFEMDDPGPLAALQKPLTLSATAEQYLALACQTYCTATAETAENEPAKAQLTLITSALLHEMLGIAERSRPRVTPAAATEPAHRLVQQVTRYLTQHMEQPVRLADLAEALAISESHLRNTFRDATDISLGRYVRQFKMVRATLLLDTTAMSVGQIADACGYDSLYAFSRAFRNEMGQSPSQYRTRT